MSKKCEITSCSKCPYFDNEYYTYDRECLKLKIEIKEDMCDVYTDVYKNCPLEDYNE